MDEESRDPVPRPASGLKYRTPQGFNAIRDGIKATAAAPVRVPGGKPRWLKAPFAGTVSTVGATIGQQVALGARLFVVEQEES